MEETQRRKLATRLNALGSAYHRYRDPTVMLALKASVLDDVWAIHSGVIRPDGAAFVVGRTFEALKPYRDALKVISDYEGAEEKLADTERVRSPEHDVSGID